MNPAKDLTGYRQPNGRLTVLRRAPRQPGSTKAHWVCRCDCSPDRETPPIPGSVIRSGQTRSCGCLAKLLVTPEWRHTVRGRCVDLTGYRQPNGLLRVIRRATIATNGQLRWVCECECSPGKETRPIIGYFIRTGEIRSCGCLDRNLTRKARRAERQVAGKVAPPQHTAT